eukprot:jgi/Mesen1/2399/ME000157S01539
MSPGKKDKDKGGHRSSRSNDDDGDEDDDDNGRDSRSGEGVGHAQVLAEMRRQMDAGVDSLARELGKLRTGRATPGMLDHVTVDAYGAGTPLNRVASVSVRDSQTLSVSLHDPNLKAAVEKGIRESPMGLNPVSEGSSLTVPIPRLTQETCQAMTKLVVKAGETVKVSLRRARKDAMDALKADSSGISEDDVKRKEKEIQEIIAKYQKQSDDLCKSKEKEILQG